MNGAAANRLDKDLSRARQFADLKRHWPSIGESAAKADSAHQDDPRTACIYARRALDLAFQWIQRRDPRMEWSEKQTLSGFVTASHDRGILSRETARMARVIRQLGNDAIHGIRPIWQYDGLCAVRELSTFLTWFQQEYGVVEAGSAAELSTPAQTSVPMPMPMPMPDRPRESRSLSVRLVESVGNLAAVRELWLERLLIEAGWQPFLAPLKKMTAASDVPGGRIRQSMPAGDFLLSNWDQTPLALLQVKRSPAEPRLAMDGMRWYADELERRRGGRPILCFANGDRLWIWDDVAGEPQVVLALPQPEELQRMIERRTGRCPLGDLRLPVPAECDAGIATCVEDLVTRLDQGGCRRLWVSPPHQVSRVAVTTNLIQVLRRAKWVRRSLNLTASPLRARRVTRVMSAWSRDLPVVNLSREPLGRGLNVVADYATLARILKWREQGRRRWGIRYFDLVVIDRASEVSRASWRAVSDYFDAYQIIWLSRASTRSSVYDAPLPRMDTPAGVPRAGY
jgi:type I restriction enzyme R subunit